MPITYGVFPQSGEPSPKTATTPTNPYHVSDHNRYDAALNEIKGTYNTFISQPKPWVHYNGVTAPWAVAANDFAYVSGVITFGTGVSDPLSTATGSFTPTAIDGLGSGTVNASVRVDWIKLAAYTAHVRVAMTVTSAWSGATAVQIPFPSGWEQDINEQVFAGYCAHVGAPFGIHYPLVGIAHGKTSGSGGTVNGVTLSPAAIRFIVPT